MGSRPLSLIRFPIVLLALGDLALLAARLRPWSEITNLPGQGTTGYDPIICLLAYALLLFWTGGNRDELVQKALSHTMLFSLPAGVALIGYAYLADLENRQNSYLQLGLLGLAAVLWGLAGMKGAKIGKSPNLGIGAGVWSAMISAMMGAAYVLSRVDLSNPPPQSLDPWKQYQGLAIGNQVVQSLVHSLNTTTAFLLLSPLAGALLGLLFAMATQD